MDTTNDCSRRRRRRLARLRHHLQGAPPPRQVLVGAAAELEPDALLEINVLEPGLVVIRNFLTGDQQRRLADEATQWGSEGESGFYTALEGAGEPQLNADDGRGRIYDAAERFPDEFIAHSARASALAAVDPHMPKMECSHVLINMYQAESGLVWHRDIYENDGQSDHPVVNLSVGVSCVFGIRCPSGLERHLLLRSGDVLLFGGPCRFAEHAVLEVRLDDRPSWMPRRDEAKRFSFTFRDSPEVRGREEEFKYFKPDVHLVGQESFEENAPALLPALPTQKAAL